MKVQIKKVSNQIEIKTEYLDRSVLAILRKAQHDWNKEKKCSIIEENKLQFVWTQIYNLHSHDIILENITIEEEKLASVTTRGVKYYL